MLRCFLHLARYDTAGHCRPRTFPQYHSTVFPWCAECHTRYECFCAALLLVVICLTDLACALARIYKSVRCVKSESFEAHPRWLEELKNLVTPEVVEIVVGNKLDKVCNHSSPLPSDSPSPAPYLPTLLSSPHWHFFPPSGRLPTVFTHVCTPSRNTPDKCSRQRPRRSQRALDVFLLKHRPRQRWA